MTDNIIETKTCISCGSSFTITDGDRDFYEKVSPIFAGKKYQIPSPTLCPECRFQRRASFRNLDKLYKRTSDITGKSVISIYSPDKPYKVYENEYRRSDKWDATNYAQDFDTNESFFRQFDALLRQVPKISLSTEKLENADYVNYSGWVKNCYLVFICAYDENCYYCHGVRYSNNCIDCAYSQHLENCYQVSDTLESYNCTYLQNAKHCDSCSYSDNLIGCRHCLFCINLVNEEYHVLNQKVSKEYFEEVVKRIKEISVLQDFLVQYHNLRRHSPRKENYSINSERCSGEYILNSSNVHTGFGISNVQDSKYVDWLFDSKNCFDVFDWGETAENCYECYKIGKGVNKTCFSAFCISDIHNLLYCYDCVSGCSDCFGCVGLKNKQYCILNKQYTKEEYEKLVPQTIEKMISDHEWGEFFPSHISPFGYNETVANEYYPLTRDVALKRGFNRSNFEAPFPQVDKILKVNALPNIQEVTDDILQQAIECEITKKPFRIIKQCRTQPNPHSRIN